MSLGSRSRHKLRTSDKDIAYRDYLQRRGTDVQSEAYNLPPLPYTTASRRSRTSGSYHSYKPEIHRPIFSRNHNPTGFNHSGYKHYESDLGTDPLTEMRLMRAQMRRMTLNSAKQSRDVRTQFFQEANRVLRNSEIEMERLQRARTDAIIRGDTPEVHRLGREMRNLRAKATYDAYADLLLDERQLAAYGVRSKWASGSSRPRDAYNHHSPYWRELRLTRDNTDRWSHANTRLNTHRHKRYSNSNDFHMDGRNIRSPPARANSHDHYRDEQLNTSRRHWWNRRDYNSDGGDQTKERNGVKRNRRLADIPLPKEMPTQPKMPKPERTFVPDKPTNGETGFCPQCFARDPAYTHEDVLKKHWHKQCPCLTRCEYCSELLHISELNSHHLAMCQFVKDNQEPCPLCGLAQYQGDYNHPRCPRKPPPPGAVWCALCSRSVAPGNSRDAWRKHLIDDCYNNPRNLRRWSGRNAPMQGESLLEALDTDMTPLMVVNKAPFNTLSVPNQKPYAGASATNAPGGVTTEAQPAGAGEAAAAVSGGGGFRKTGVKNGPSPEKVREAYYRLQKERRLNYEKQRALDDAAHAEEEEEDV